jgi:hypothetical protein
LALSRTAKDLPADFFIGHRIAFDVERLAQSAQLKPFQPELLRLFSNKERRPFFQGGPHGRVSPRIERQHPITNPSGQLSATDAVQKSTVSLADQLCFSLDLWTGKCKSPGEALINRRTVIPEQATTYSEDRGSESNSLGAGSRRNDE